MNGGVLKKTWVSALTVLSFVVVGISGLLLLVHVMIPAVNLKHIHVAMGVILLAMGAIHLTLNWRTFTAHLRHRSAVVALVVGTLICLALLLAGGQERERDDRFPGAGRGNGPNAEYGR